MQQKTITAPPPKRFSMGGGGQAAKECAQNDRDDTLTIRNRI